MAWLSELAGKAETLLNKLDSEAAIVLTDGPSTLKKRQEKINDNAHHQNNYGDTRSLRVGGLASSASVPLNLYQYKGSQTPSSGALVGSATKPGSSASTPHHSSYTYSDTNQSNTASPAPSHSSHSRQSSLSSLLGRVFDHDTLAQSSSRAPEYTSLSVEDTENSNSSQASECSSGTNFVSFVKVEPTELAISPPLSAASSADLNRDQGFTDSTEAELLRKEVMSLNQEMTQLFNRTKQAELEAQTLRSAQLTGSSQQQATEKLLRDVQQRELDLQECIAAKESQVAVLKVRLQEKDEEMAAQSKAMELLKGENASLCEGASVSSGLHSQALQTAQDKLREAQSALERERSLHRSSISANTERVKQLEEEQQQLLIQTKEAQNKYKSEVDKQMLLQTQVSNLKSEITAVREEFETYKQRATGILQSKEELIDKLKQGIVGDRDEQHSEIIASELSQARAELTMCREELSKSSEQLSRARAELSELERVCEQESSSHIAALTELQDELAELNKGKDELHQENNHLREELRCVHEELSRNKVAFTGHLQDRENEIEKLRRQICLKENSSNSTNDLERKIKSLTEAVIEKQSIIERLNTNYQATNLQLQRLQTQYDDSQAMLNRDPGPPYTNMEDVRCRVPTLLVESPFDGGVTRRVKRAYTTLDRLCLSTGMLLRRSPVARIAMLMYLMFLHLWVMVVLLTYSPEVHPTDYHNSASAQQHPPLPN